NVQPIADRHPTDRREEKQQRRGRDIEIEYALEVQPDARLIGGDERHRNDHEIGQSEQDLDFSVMAAEHSENRITVWGWWMWPADRSGPNGAWESDKLKTHGEKPSSGLQRRHSSTAGAATT